MSAYTLKLDWDESRIVAVRAALEETARSLMVAPADKAELRGALDDIDMYRDAAVVAVSGPASRYIPIREQIAEAVQRIVDYNWDDEARDYEEHREDGEAHIFSDLSLVRNWLGVRP
jgi:hypothetical protein